MPGVVAVPRDGRCGTAGGQAIAARAVLQRAAASTMPAELQTGRATVFGIPDAVPA